MTAKARDVDLLVLLAVALGVLGDVLFRKAGWGVNITIWFLALFSAVAVMRHRFEYTRLSRYVWVAVGLSVLAVFRDAFILKLITVIALLGAVSFSTLSTAAAERLKQTVFSFLGRVADTLFASFAVIFDHMPSVLSHVEPEQLIPNATTIRVLRGSALAIATLFVFGSLLVSADAAFERMVMSSLDIDGVTVLTHMGLVGFWGWLACTMLFVLTTGPTSVLSATRDEPRTTGYAIEVNIMLATINVLFIAFVWVQAGYFFGGHERVLDPAGPSYAEYARRGFFEIATVALLAFAMVLISDHFIPLTKSTGRRGFNGLTALHVGLMGVLIASAFHRLMLYVQVYGLTELRFYVATAIIWIGIAFLLLGFAVMRPNRAFLPHVLVCTLFIAVFALHTINPAAIIVHTNLTRDNAREDFDIEYAVSMSGDAVPTLLDGLGYLSEEQRDEIEIALAERWTVKDEPSYRDWNYSRWKATRTARRVLEQRTTSD